MCRTRSRWSTPPRAGRQLSKRTGSSMLRRATPKPGLSRAGAERAHSTASPERRSHSTNARALDASPLLLSELVGAECLRSARSTQPRLCDGKGYRALHRSLYIYQVVRFSVCEGQGSPADLVARGSPLLFSLRPAARHVDRRGRHSSNELLPALPSQLVRCLTYSAAEAGADLPSLRCSLLQAGRFPL